MRTKRRFSHQGIEEPLINLTPLIDVVFVVLIVFILAAPLLELDQVKLADGAIEAVERAAANQSTSPITIHVRRDNTILFNQRIIPLSDLRRELKQAHLRHPTARPQLFHDRQATFGTYQTIKNGAEEAGFKEIDVILKPA